MQFDFVKEALLASEIRENDRLVECEAKLDRLHQRIVPDVGDFQDPIAKARALFDWLWSQKPFRYKSDGSFRLNEVIDAQMSLDSLEVGNCLGLTLLYNCLLRKFAIKFNTIHLECAFGVGPHVLTILETKESLIDCENILQNGFDYKGHLNNPSRTRWETRELIADIYHSVGNECFEKGRHREALKNYNMAITLNPQYEKARLNKVILLDKMGS